MNIISEIGSNWKTLSDCLNAIKKSKLCGADIVKFQMFSHEELYGQKDPIDEGFRSTTPYLNPEWIPELANEAKNQDIQFMCTAFSVSGYRYINEYVSKHKIASSELTDINILKEVNSYKKPVLLSTGGADLNLEIRHALLLLKDCPVTIMFCVSDYPAKIIDFRRFVDLQAYFGANYQYGFSDHSIDTLIIPERAKNMGATIIEKHTNFFDYTDTNDATHSLNENEFKVMCSFLKNKPLSQKELSTYTNSNMDALHKRRYVATKPINQGDLFKLNWNVGIYRATQPSIDPVLTFRSWDVEGKSALRDIKPGDVICYPDVLNGS